VEVEKEVEEIVVGLDFGSFGEDPLVRLKQLEAKRSKLLLDKDMDWRIKNRDTWLELGDKNTKFFHSF
jgi:hypothetical protein